MEVLFGTEISESRKFQLLPVLTLSTLGLRRSGVALGETVFVRRRQKTACYDDIKCQHHSPFSLRIVYVRVPQNFLVRHQYQQIFISAANKHDYLLTV